MVSKYKKIKKLIELRLDAIEADLKAIQHTQIHIHRRLDAIEEKIEDVKMFPTHRSMSRLEELND